ncbi:MAG: thioredoxin domain-containing protein [Deltaproteobacteria bacterium]|nr:thioredoxin domain-containing protein [Deltaproteobacteria bacterium]
MRNPHAARSTRPSRRPAVDGRLAPVLPLLLLAAACGPGGPGAAEPGLGADGRSDLAGTGGRFDGDLLPGRPGRPAPPRPAPELDPLTELPLATVAPCPSAPSLGPADAPLQVVVFTEFQCPFCRRHAGDLDRLAEHYADRLHLVFRHFPLRYHDLSQVAAEASLAAHAEGKFWEFHDRLMDPEAGDLTVERIRRTAAEVGLDLGRFETAIRNATFAAAVERDLADGRAAEVEGTPATYINRRQVTGMVGFERLVEICDRLLEAAP